ncbi:MAG: hypothetical protein R3A48_29375 [Polyangiales bacterium]
MSRDYVFATLRFAWIVVCSYAGSRSTWTFTECVYLALALIALIAASVARCRARRSLAEEARRRRAAEEELRGVLFDAAMSGGLRVEMTETGYELTYGPARASRTEKMSEES